MKHLTAADILKQQNSRQTRRHEAFNIILDNCYKRIQKCVQVLRNVHSCFFEVPEFLIGYPLYELNECIQYCIDILTSKGFAVQYIFPRILMISWLTPRSQALPAPAPRNRNANANANANGNANANAQGKKPQGAGAGDKKIFVQKKATNVKKFLLDLS